jgi:hypothetical protein
VPQGAGYATDSVWETVLQIELHVRVGVLATEGVAAHLNFLARERIGPRQPAAGTSGFVATGRCSTVASNARA